ncbi:MAG: glycosyltransferase family 2 protein [Rhodothermales bacterium]|nr:glycosyltransferase family 2 protein [Rhodothermales bacterium]
MTLFLAAVHAVHWLILLGNVVYLRRQRRRAAAYPALSVLIPARNEEENLRRLLPTLRAQDYPGFEVLVYDDGSEDGTGRVVAEAAAQDARIRGLRGEGPPPGWVGKVHALYRATREARGARYLFLDADAELLRPDALRRLADRLAGAPDGAVLTGLTRLRGGGRLVVSLVPNAILTGLPWPLVRRLPLASLGALNGQCWMISADAYHHHEPHEAHPDEVLEDVRIGRYLKARGMTPVLADLHDDVAIHMYRDLGDAWRGFRKNAYLILGGRVPLFFVLAPLYLFTFVLAPFFSLWFLLSLYGLKLVTDRLGRFPLWLTALAPLSYALGALQQIDSAVAHWTGHVAWKGRRVGAAAPTGEAVP